jgi:septal ring factor EnvC (AmiA/AmiB activator)
MSTRNENNSERNERLDRGFTVREDTIFDYLMHAATREDIASLRSEVKEDIAKLDAKIDRIGGHFDSKIDRLDAKIDRVEKGLDAKIDKLRIETKEDISKLSTKIDSHFKALVGIILVGFALPFVLKLFT